MITAAQAKLNADAVIPTLQETSDTISATITSVAASGDYVATVIFPAVYLVAISLELTTAGYTITEQPVYESNLASLLIDWRDV